MDITLGFSTGALYKSGLSLKERLRLFRDLGLPAVELNFVEAQDLYKPEVMELTASDVFSFEYVSLHAPARDTWYGDNVKTGVIAERIAALNSLLQLDLVVFHPDRVMDFSVFNKLPFNVAFENMDRRKPWGKTVGYMQELLGQNEAWGFVLDVNHAFTNNQTLRLTAEFWHCLGHRVSQIHLSGYNMENGYHDALHETQQTALISSVVDFSKPIIVESVLTPETLQAERDYILETIDRLRNA